MDKVALAERMSKLTTRRHQEGDTRIGWQSRAQVSYPEKFFEQLLTSNGIIFEREIRVGKWFCDFVIGNNVLEMDGNMTIALLKMQRKISS